MSITKVRNVMLQGYRFGSKSEGKLSQAHPDLVKVLRLGLRWSVIDWGISQTARTIEKQREYFEAGFSKINPDDPEQLLKSRHVIHEGMPMAMAADIYSYYSDADTRARLSYDNFSLCHIQGIIRAAACHLLESGQITHGVRWGGNWDGDGVILDDQTFDDLPHVELLIIETHGE